MKKHIFNQPASERGRAWFINFAFLIFNLPLAALMIGSSSAHAATVAYWRFETGPANTDVPHPGAAGVFNAIIPDDSGNGNSLSVWAQGGEMAPLPCA